MIFIIEMEKETKTQTIQVKAETEKKGEKKTPQDLRNSFFSLENYHHYLFVW